jgi:hypothetical protein
MAVPKSYFQLISIFAYTKNIKHSELTFFTLSS